MRLVQLSLSVVGAGAARAWYVAGIPAARGAPCNFAFKARLYRWLGRFREGSVTASARTVDPRFLCLYALQVPRVDGGVGTFVRVVRADVAICGQLTAALAVCILVGRRGKVLAYVRVKLRDFLEQAVCATVPFVGTIAEEVYHPWVLCDDFSV